MKLLWPRDQCFMPVAYKTRCRNHLSGDNTLCAQCLLRKWGDGKMLDMKVDDGAATIEELHKANYVVDFHGNNDAAVQMLGANLHKVATLLLGAKHPIYGHNYFSYLCAALRHHDDEMLLQMLSYPEFRQYCDSKLIGPKKCYRFFMARQCVYWNSLACMEHLLLNGFFTKRKFTCKVLTAIVSNTSVDFELWTRVWNMHFKQTFDVHWHSYLFALALTANNDQVAQFLAQLDQFSICICDVQELQKIKVRQWLESHWNFPMCSICCPAPAPEPVIQPMDDPPSFRTPRRRQRRTAARRRKNT